MNECTDAFIETNHSYQNKPKLRFFFWH